MSVQRGLMLITDTSDVVGLIGKYEKGDHRAGEQLEAIIRNLLNRRIRRSDVAPQAADELVQESILQVFSRIGEYCEDRGSFEGWIGGFALNTIRAHRRREYRTRTTAMPVDDTFELSYEIDVNEGEQDLLLTAISSLDILDQELLHMRYTLGMSSDEIAESSDLNAPQVRKRISRAMERLRRHPSVRQVLA